MVDQFMVTKVWPAPGKGISCAFRQWRAKTHCRRIHGYDLWFNATFSCTEAELTEEGWVIDFGNLDIVKQRLEAQFDHKLLVAADDPEMDWFQEAEQRGIAKLMIMPDVGCEAFAQWFADVVKDAVVLAGRHGQIRIRSVRVFEHSVNSVGFNPILEI